MKNKVKINVTHKDILEGERCMGASCPVALAVKRSARISDIWIGPTAIESPEFKEVIALPKKAISFIKYFDGEKKVKPFSFILKYETT